MPAPNSEAYNGALIAALHPIAEQAARIIQCFRHDPASHSSSDSELAARVGRVSAEHVAIVRRTLIESGLARRSDFSVRIVASAVVLERLAANLEGVAIYLRVHKDRDSVRLVITEPGENSPLKNEIARRHAIPPIVFQTSDAFINLARSATRELIILVPFIDDPGAEFLLRLFELCSDDVHRCFICRPLTEPHCGPAFIKRSGAFSKLKVSVYEYALPSSLPSAVS